MTDKIAKFSAGLLNRGVNLFTSDFTTKVELSLATYNMISGINDGVGPRYGMAPIPGHADTETVPLGGPRSHGLMVAETAYGLNTQSAYMGGAQGSIAVARVKFFGLVPMRLRGYDANIANVSTSYVALVGFTTSTYPGRTFLDVAPLSQIGQVSASAYGLQYQHTGNIYDGLADPLLNEAGMTYSNAGLLAVEQVAPLIGSGTAPYRRDQVANTLDVTGFNYLSYTPFNVNGPSVQAEWLMGQIVGTPATNAAPKIDFSFSQWNGLYVNPGIPPEINLGTFKKTTRSTLIFGYKGSTGQTVGAWSVGPYTPNSTYFVPSYCQTGGAGGSAQLQLPSTPLSYSQNATNALAVTQATMAVVQDVNFSIASSIKGVLVAAGKGIMTLFQEWYRTPGGKMTQVVDLSNLPLEPKSFTSGYQEDGVAVPTCFNYFPGFTRGTETLSAGFFSLGAANTGTLRANTVYEFSYSIYNKRLNYETNVGRPVKIQIGATNDFRSLNIATSVVNLTSCLAGFVPGSNNMLLPWPGTPPGGGYVGTDLSDVMPSLNYLQYRFYYRQEGMQEWLPASFVDAVQYWFGPRNGNITACTGGIGGLPGGRSGGFTDYSRLPDDKYNCVVVYKNRAFWLSDSAIQFSPINNFFAYPARNSIACPAGNFKGAIVHAYYGQAQQDARLVVFASICTYVGKFTGDLLQVPVQVSTTTVANFGLDGSDFVLNTWTSATAFSYRAAVVAEGVLYFWGPKGIWRDGGVAVPDRISMPMEPDIWTLYDPSKTDQIFAVYNDQTKQIIWFYSPKVADGYATHGLVYDTVEGEFYPQKWVGQIDQAQALNVETNVPTAGHRMIVMARETAAATVQRPYFFDHRNRTGDIFPRTEMMVKQVSTPSTGLRRLTLAAGFDATKFASMAVGDYLSLAEVLDYANGGMTSGDSMIAQINALNAGAGTIDVVIPAGSGLNVQFDGAATLTQPQFFPVWHVGRASQGLNGIPYLWQTGYWIPQGINFNGFWMYVYLLFKLKALPATKALQIAIAYRTPTAQALVSDLVTLATNSDGNMQLYHPLRPDSAGSEGQGLKLQISGNHIGGEWVLQYLEAHANPSNTDFLKQFEG